MMKSIFRWIVGMYCFVLSFHIQANVEGDNPPPELAIADPNLNVVAGESVSVPVPNLVAGRCYGTLVYIPDLKALGDSDRLTILVDDALGSVTQKVLHAGDPDLYLTLKPRKSGAGKITASFAADAGRKIEFKTQVIPMKIGDGAKSLIGALPSGDWRNAQPIELGRTVFASNDERPYIPVLGSPTEQLNDLFAGGQWYTFTYAGPNPTLAHFDVTILDRDIPVDVALFVREGESLVPYTEGVERFIPEKSTAFHGLYKFIARSLKPGTYYLRVMGNHPAYQLRTKLYPLPPYDDPRQAVRTGMDYLIKKGDSWHANTPRRGGVILRSSNPLQETSACIACHPTHFTTRGELIAIENGYPLRERASMQFLTERLYNNPRPIYGKPEAAWVRMISAPGNVMSRLAYMLFTFEKTISHEQREGLLPEIGNYLEMYWKNLDAIHAESNGNQPRVSGFEIAMHNGLLFEELYRRTGEEKYKALREKMEKLEVGGEPQDHIDLCWQTVALATFDKAGHEKKLAELTEEIFSRQREDGTWALPYGKDVYEHDYRKQQSSTKPAPLNENGEAASSEFQTYHCIYALAKAGVTMDDPRLARAVKWCLSRQQPSGCWQGNKDYKNFDTPFRDTQYAIMALSELFKGPTAPSCCVAGASGWSAGFDPAPVSFDLDDTAAALDALDQYWEKPEAETRELIRKALDNPQPLVRHAAAAAAGRIADTEAIPILARRLGDPSKMVQRAAAWSLRQIASRRGTGYLAIQSAMASKDDRTRWGADRIFNQHFRYLSDKWNLARILMDQMKDDPAPAVRMEAAQALWRWWYWTKSDENKGDIEDRFILCMSKPEHPWVRRNLIEGFHNLIDDNVSYLYNSWIRQISTDEDREIVTNAHHATAKRQAEKIARALANGSELQRDGILRGFYTFHLRENGGDEKAVASVMNPPFTTGDWLIGYRQYAAYDPRTMGTGTLARIGNDSDLPAYYEDSGPLMAEGLAAVIANAPPERAMQALLALKNADGVVYGATLSKRLLDLAQNAADSTPGMKETLKGLLPKNIENSAEVAHELAGLIARGNEGALDTVEAILTDKRNSMLVQDPGLAGALKERILGADLSAADLPGLERMLVHSTELQGDKGIIDKSFDALISGPSRVRRSAVQAMITGDRFLVSGPARERFEAELNVGSDEMFLDMLQVIGRIDFAKLENESSLNLGLGVVTAGLSRPSPEVKRKALDALRTMVMIQQNPSVIAALRTLALDPNDGVKKSAETLLKSIKIRGEKASDQDVGALLDYEYFKKRIEPILQTKGADKEACAECHMNHSIMKLNPRAEGSKLSEAELRENYLSAMRVVDLNNPEESLILLKPRMPFDGIELPGHYRKSHGGNVRWKDGRENADYQTILKWIQGAKSEAEVGLAP